MTEREDGLQDPRLTALYRRKDGEQPPARLDAAIRKAAHAVVKKPASRRLWPSLATAALLVLGVGVALKVFEQPELDRLRMDRSSLDRSSLDRPSEVRPSLEQRDGDATLLDEARAKREFTPRTERKITSEALPAAPVPAVTPGPSIAEQAASTLMEPKGAVDMRAVEREGALVEGTDNRDFVPIGGERDVHCTVYGDLFGLSEDELQDRLERFRRRQDRAAIQCLEQALERAQRGTEERR